MIYHRITIDKVRDAFRKAQETPADENMFRQLRLNQWVKQSVRWMPMDMSPPTKELMRLVLERKLNHGGHPVLRWNMDNAFVRTDPAGNLKIDKEKSTEKVDGAVALVMALDRALKNANSGASVYDDRGFLII